jgi:hypothetical protein
VEGRKTRAEVQHRADWLLGDLKLECTPELANQPEVFERLQGLTWQVSRVHFATRVSVVHACPEPGVAMDRQILHDGHRTLRATELQLRRGVAGTEAEQALLKGRARRCQSLCTWPADLTRAAMQPLGLVTMACHSLQGFWAGCASITSSRQRTVRRCTLNDTIPSGTPHGRVGWRRAEVAAPCSGGMQAWTGRRGAWRAQWCIRQRAAAPMRWRRGGTARATATATGCWVRRRQVGGRPVPRISSYRHTGYSTPS